ncbi:MAG TPA: hypothetical protein VHM26_07065 [Chitinophagaceae bacterium]|nr:hypothetical protein [Chitinophagaceae bacterium]
MKSTLICLLSITLLVFSSCAVKEKPLTKEEALAFAKKIEKSIENEDERVFDQAFDYNALSKKLELPKGFKRKDFLDAAAGKMKMARSIISSLGDKGSYKLIRHYEKDGVHHLLFRLYSDGGLNYHDMELTRSKGECKIADMYLYMTGSRISESLTEVYEQLFTELDKGKNARTEKWMDSLSGIRQNILEQNYTRARELLDQVPPHIRKGKMFQIASIEIADGMGPEEFDEAIREFETLFPNDESLNLLILGAYMVRKEFDKALQAIDKLDTLVGTDPLLNYHRSICYYNMDQQDKSIEKLELLLKEMPHFEDGLQEMIGTLLGQKEYDKAHTYVKQLQAIPSHDAETLKTLLEYYPGYAEKYPQ